MSLILFQSKTAKYIWLSYKANCFLQTLYNNYYLDLKHNIAATASAVKMDPVKANVIFFHTCMSSKIGVVVRTLEEGEYTAIKT